MLRNKLFKNTCAVLASISLVLCLAPAPMAYADGGEDSQEPSVTEGDTETGDSGEGEVEAVTYKLTFDSKKGSSVAPVVVEENQTVADFPVPTRTGYTFLGWNDASGMLVESVVMDSDKTLYAMWESSAAINSAAKVVPYLTVKSSYSSGSLGTDGKNVKAGSKVTVSNSASTKRLERLSIKISKNKQILGHKISASYSMGIKYRILRGGKWSGWKSNGATVGTKGKRVEAVQLRLTGTVAQYYNIYYCVKPKSSNYLGWAKNGASAGTTGLSHDISELKIVLVKKTKKAPGSSSCNFIKSSYHKGSYGAVSKSKAATATQKMGATVGTAKKTASPVSRIKATATANPVSGGIKYAAYKYKAGWTKYARNGALTGGSAKKAVMAIKMSLTGKMAKYYDVYYRVYIKGYGWMGWAKNGQAAGNTTYNLPVTAYQMKIVFKGSGAPGSTSNYFSGAQGILCDLAGTKILQAKAKKFSSNTDYLIILDTTLCRLAVFKGSKGNWTMIKYWKAGVGAYSTPTVKGVFTTSAHVYEFGREKGYSCWYATQFYGDYLFHSEVYNIGSKTEMQSSGLGYHVSHGCCRLAIANAKWIYDNVPLGTKVYVYGD